MAIYLSNRDGNGKTSEEGHYRLQTRILKGVVLKTNDLKVSQTSPLSLGIKVGTGDYRIDTPEGYAYTGWITDEQTLSLTAADAANPRLSSIVIYVDKSAATNPAPPNNPGVTKLIVVNGTPAATPVAPTTPIIQTAVGSGNPFAILANVQVNANATTVTDANITDTRVRISLIDEILESANIKGIIGPVMYPVGSLYINTTDSTNPATLLGFGTWIAYAAGRVPVGIDSTQVEFDTIGETGGSKTHTITNAQLPPHWHSIFLNTAHGDGEVSSYEALTAALQGGGRFRYRGGTGQGHNGSGFMGNGEVDGSTRAATAHNILQPYIVVYMWRRTA